MSQAPVTETGDKPVVKLYWWIQSPHSTIIGVNDFRLDQSRSQRILWLLEELNVPYELIIFHRDKQTRLAPPELKEVHALGKSPVITVTPAGSTTPVVIAESAFIIEYLIQHFGAGTNLAPKQWKEGQEGKVGGETEEYLRFRYFMHYAEGSLMTLMLLSIVSLSELQLSSSAAGQANGN